MKAAVWLAAGLLIAITAAAAQNSGSETPGAAAADAGTRRPMTFADMMRLRRLGDLDVSPDGRWVLFTATDADLARNSRTPHLWIVPAAIQPPTPAGSAAGSVQQATADAGGERPLMAWMAGESRGRFSPDGKRILFESPRNGSEQIWLADFDTLAGTISGERQLTHIGTGAENATWSPDGKHILFTSSVYPECGLRPDGTAASGAHEDGCDRRRDEEQAQNSVKAQIFTRLLYRHWNQFTGDKRSHLFLLSTEDGIFRDLNPGDEHDVPPFSLGEPDGWDFSPDGREIAYEEKKVDDPALSTDVDIFTLELFDAAGDAAWGAKPKRISTSPGGDFTPRYSPDGKWIAWRMQKRKGYESDRFRLVIYNRAAKVIREAMPGFDRWVDEIAWSADSAALYFTAGNAGEEPIFAENLVAGQPDALPEQLTRTGTYADLHPAGRRLIASRMTVKTPGEIVVLDTAEVGHLPFDAGDRGARPLEHPQIVPATQLTHLNDVFLAQLNLPAMESFWFTSLGGVRVQGFLIRPPDFDPGKKYPVKFLIHGGPQGAWGNEWSYRWNPELLAANGYVVVMINPRGSTGYGQAFTDAVNGDWGGRPYVDLMRGLDYAEQHYSFIDRKRECALGASYGGYMANWILGHTDRFRCIVSHDGMFDPVSAYGTTDELWFSEWEFKGTPWTNRLLYRRWSPMLAEAHFKTPTLVIHGQLDYRLDVSEGFQLFDTLQRMKVPSEMLYFPDEGHWVLKPQNAELWYKTVNAWVDQWTR